MGKLVDWGHLTNFVKQYFLLKTRQTYRPIEKSTISVPTSTSASAHLELNFYANFFSKTFYFIFVTSQQQHFFRAKQFCRFSKKNRNELISVSIRFPKFQIEAEFFFRKIIFPQTSSEILFFFKLKNHRSSNLRRSEVRPSQE